MQRWGFGLAALLALAWLVATCFGFCSCALSSFFSLSLAGASGVPLAKIVAGAEVSVDGTVDALKVSVVAGV
ncbi:MAG: hypothetical protein Q7R45_03835, partial [Sulfuricaulis sp.]|nr:hypothetical protein [Sulfuricaulis sp.]